MIYNRVIIE